MRKNFVIDPLIGKRQQLLLATQLCRMVLKVCSFLPRFLVRIRHLTVYTDTSVEQVNNVIIAGNDDEGY